MLTVIVWTVLICGAVALVHWAVPRLGTPAPLANVVLVGSIVIAIIVIVFMWLGLFGMAPPLR
jgi:hypothetical protein